MSLQTQSLKIEKVWAMPNHKTFEIPPIKKLLDEETLPGNIIDPFPHPFQKDALEYLKGIERESQVNVRFDPPYSQRQLREMYDSAGLALDEMNNGYWSKCRIEIARILKPGGRAISFGWNSAGIGKNLGFRQYRILLVAHGSQHNDTIVTCEVKEQSSLDNIREGM